jgi:hypothetical protein
MTSTGCPSSSKSSGDFTGVEDLNDDQVDAGVALHDLLMAGTTGGGGAAANDDHDREAA